MTHSGRLVLLNDAKLINEIFVARADMVSNKVDNYLENQLRYKEGKHIRTGSFFSHRLPRGVLFEKEEEIHLPTHLGEK